jgi:RNA polymerase sigma-70 factor (ECF subfamily)
MTTLRDMLQKARRAVLRRGVPDDEADDLVHEAFLKLEGYGRQHVIRSREAFLVSAAVNLSIDRARRRERSPFDELTRDLDAVPAVIAGPDEILSARARLKHLEEGIARLPDRTRRILLMRRLDGADYRRIAEAEGMSVAAVEKQVARATLTLMNWMQEW